jgi:hypothetical protein
MSIVVVATEGDDKYSNTLKRLTGLAKENTSCGETYLHSRVSLPTSIIAMLHQYTKLKEVL